MQIKPDKTADFESVMAKLRDALTKTDKPERKQQASGWKIYKSTEPGPGGNVLYVAVINPVAQGGRLHRGEDPVRGVSDRSADDFSDLPGLVCRGPEPHEPEPACRIFGAAGQGQTPAAPAPPR